MKNIKKTNGRNKYFLYKSLFKLTDFLIIIFTFGYYYSTFEYEHIKNKL